uniref:Fungal lipase-type domain-containing protein n=1 Tax=Odontella aurita TaxID=265563 RepID=A0A7S4JH85_9STRA|mmetsp:Transcript_46487/g.140833  ORF Transcript_46487/g.140833 Transcript_46487/m.140833 type:complete len:479 (+) Transcript_46487:135-1571(+)
MKVTLGPTRGGASIADAATFALLQLPLLLSTSAPLVAHSFSLTEDALSISDDAVRLSDLSYGKDDVLTKYGGAKREISGGAEEASITELNGHPDYDDFEYVTFYTQEPDQALVAKKDYGQRQRCYLAFRGTRDNVPDWLQNLDLRDRVVHRNNDTKQEGCEVRNGYVDFLDSSVVHKVFEDIVECMESIACDDGAGDCLVVTGHSQGGASAAIASILLYDLYPTVVTFGQPPACDGGCDSIPSDRYYRYVNSMREPNDDDDRNEQAFDPVPFVPTLLSRSSNYGHGILLGEDPRSVKYLGLDGDADAFLPSVFDRRNKFEAHSIGTDSEFDYDRRIITLSENAPVSTDGFSDGIFCDRDYGELCASGRCSFENACSSEATETCVVDGCDDDADCDSGACVRGACAPGKGRVEGGCPCFINRNCASGDCNMKITTLMWTCEYGPDEEIRRQSVSKGGSISLGTFMRTATLVPALLLLLA